MNRAALAAAILLASCSGAGRPPDRPSDWEEKNARILGQERANVEVPAPPAYPAAQNLLPFFVTSASDFRYYVDRTSVAVGNGIVRYVLVARAPGGAENVSFEGLNCKEREYRSYARGTSERKWLVRASDWRRIDPQQHLAQHTLHWEYLCPNRIAVHTADEGVDALQNGGHPWSKKPDAAGPGGSN